MKTEKTIKKTVVRPWDEGKKYWMANEEYAGIAVGKESTGSEYVISTGVIAPGGFVPDHYHKWEDQTFHVVAGVLSVKIGDDIFQAETGATIHCPRGVSHYMKNVGDEQAKLVSYIFPGDWAEDFMAETSRQNESGLQNFELIEERFGVVYI